MSRIVRLAIDIEAKREHIMNSIDQEYENFLQQEQQDHFRNKDERITRNLLLLGPSKSGKTTLTHVLNDPRYIPKEFTLASSSDTEIICTRDVRPESAFISLNIVEIPAHMIDQNSNLSDINQACMKLGINDFHLVCFCASFITGIDGYTIKSFTRLIQHFDEQRLRHNLFFIITRCETKDDVQRYNISDELLHDIDFSKLTKNQTDRIYFSGALNPDDYNRAHDTLYDQFETVYYYRKELLQIIQSNIKPFHISLAGPPIHMTQTSLPSNSQHEVSILQPQPTIRRIEPLSSEHNYQNDSSIPMSNEEPTNQSGCCSYLWKYSCIFFEKNA